jgi:hypothetical protein
MSVSGMKGNTTSPKILGGLNPDNGFVGMIENRHKIRK